MYMVVMSEVVVAGGAGVYIDNTRESSSRPTTHEAVRSATSVLRCIRSVVMSVAERCIWSYTELVARLVRSFSLMSMYTPENKGKGERSSQSNHCRLMSVAADVS